MSTTTERTHNLANIDVNNLAAIREAVEVASSIGHWRRILAIYGDHLPACAKRRGGECDCAWDRAFDP